ncbi:MAG: aminoacetone oxidase family FAD-binding enzyme [Acidobacteria bacterium]|nr:aminoacetone oxidase family FAD-binding enzyme [Acidobacteriota bacterium]MSO62885.1 aminoacetone oxidase family FAD-binding enzyme [Acidobacteriota bacterium]
MSVAVVGGGAAGLVAAAFAATGGAEVTLIERTADGGRKILISGGGRCNVLPSELALDRFVTDSPAHLLRGMLRSWPLPEQRAFFERDLGIPLALEEASGKLFPQSNRAKDIRDGLVAFARARGVRMQFSTSVTAIQPSTGGFTLRTSNGDLQAARVILATGGLSVPATGSDGTGLQVAAELGHRLIPTYPALTPLLGSSASGHALLSGVSLDVRLRAKPDGRMVETSGGFLFTHRGYSGPSVLDISHTVTRESRSASSASSAVTPGAMADRSVAIRAQWSALDAAAWESVFDAPSTLISSLLARHVPARLGEHLMREAGIPPDRRTSGLRRTERLSLIGHLTSYVLPVGGDEGYKKAEVTGGGVALDEVEPRTLESRRCQGLYFCGEILDAFGPIGGHNFAWAWATGRAAGLAAAEANTRTHPAP